MAVRDLQVSMSLTVADYFLFSGELPRTCAKFAKRLAKSIIPPDGLIAYNGWQLVAVDKCPDVRPIGIGEVMRRVTGRIIVDCIRQDLTSLVGNMQLCMDQKSGIEHAIHSLRHSFNDPENEAILLIDTKNAFNMINRQTALENVNALCPSLHVALQNSHSHRLISTSVSWPFCLRKVRNTAIPLRWQCMESQSYPL